MDVKELRKTAQAVYLATDTEDAADIAAKMLAAASTIEKLKEALHICIHGEPDLDQNEWRQVRRIYENT